MSEQTSTAIAAKPIEEARWEFYDAWRAFPLNEFHNTDRSTVGEFIVGLSADGGGTHGEFAIRFYRWSREYGPATEAARIEAFSDSWKVLADSRLVEALASREVEVKTPDAMREVLLGLGMHDRTDDLRGSHAVTCPSCHGKGTLA